MATSLKLGLTKFREVIGIASVVKKGRQLGGRERISDGPRKA